jgi:hypothetical protein
VRGRHRDQMAIKWRALGGPAEAHRWPLVSVSGKRLVPLPTTVGSKVDFSDHTTERNTHLHLNSKTDGSYDGAPLPRCGLSRNRRGEREPRDGAAWHFYYSERLFSDD